LSASLSDSAIGAPSPVDKGRKAALGTTQQAHREAVGLLGPVG
jgi:hypothetical protein